MPSTATSRNIANTVSSASNGGSLTRWGVLLSEELEAPLGVGKGDNVAGETGLFCSALLQPFVGCDAELVTAGGMATGGGGAVDVGFSRTGTGVAVAEVVGTAFVAVGVFVSLFTEEEDAASCSAGGTAASRGIESIGLGVMDGDSDANTDCPNAVSISGAEPFSLLFVPHEGRGSALSSAAVFCC